MKAAEVPLSKVDGIAERAEEKLRESGITSAYELASSLPDEIMQVIGGDMQNAALLISNARACLAKRGLILEDFVKASDIARRKNDVIACTTGSRALDNLLGGGIETKAVTEFFGAFGSGKSQLCHTLSVLCNLPVEKGGLDGGAIYVDTEGTFRVNRLSEIAKTRGMDEAFVLDRILYSRTYDVQHLIAVVRALGEQVRKNSIRLIVIDSVINLFRSEYIGRETLAERQQKLNTLMHRLRNVAEVYNVAVVITNQVQAVPNTFFGDPNRPAGGHVLAHGSTYRIYLRKAGEERIAAMVDSPSHPYSEARFTIGSAGVCDTSSPEEN
ncbi:MAG: DNA repair and recombination protein RadA [Conexivisphaerales archaeon]